MKRILAIFVCLILTATLFAALPLNADAGKAPDKQVPFKGNMDGNTVPSGIQYVERIEMSGQASHLGLYTSVVMADMTQGTIIDFHPSGLPIVALPLSVTFTAANGDELHTVALLIGLYRPYGTEPFNGNFPFFNLYGTIYDGTGRFDGASGSYTVTVGQLYVPGPDNDLISGTFTGSISIVGSN
jgi:hypothetical protein